MAGQEEGAVLKEGKMEKVHYSSGKDDWETPQKFFEDLNNEFNFTLDPCSTHLNAKCKYHFTEVENGLLQNWGGAYSILQSSIQ